MKRVSSFIVLIVSVGLFMVSCNSNSKGSQTGFYYYPRKNMYYDVEKNIFLYSLDSAKTWRSLANVTGKEPATLGEKVIIDKTPDEVFKNNEEHRKLYSGNLYNNINRDTTATLNPEVSERKELATRIAAARSNNSEKPKKRIKKFFEKIFGKKK